MQYWDEFLLIAISHLFAVASPGPDFTIVLKHSVRYGRSTALYTSAGIASGILLHVAYCVLGVAVVIASSPALFQLLKYLAAAYLAWIGIQALKSTPSKSNDHETANDSVLPSAMAAFKKGFLINALNPKATLFFLSLFTLVIDVKTPILIQAWYGLYMTIATGLWFAMLSFILSQQSVREFFLKAGHWFDRAIGLVLLLLAFKVTVF